MSTEKALWVVFEMDEMPTKEEVRERFSNLG